MGILILGSICTAGEAFLIYFLVQLVRDARRTAIRLRAAAKPKDVLKPQFALIQTAPWTERAVWSEGRWQRPEPVSCAVRERGEAERWEHVGSHA